jgi:hypothetical protein
MTNSLVATLLALGLTIAAGGVLLRATNLGWRGWSAAVVLWSILLSGWTAADTASMATASTLRQGRRASNLPALASPLGSPREIRRQMVREGHLKDDGASTYPWGQADSVAWPADAATVARKMLDAWPTWPR